ncbi:methyl-accepting chemotaxis protein [Pseudocolwellia agarivorans]|uniref:methyl-accepting chemotaxis protein n=1 Tax=Pseudocolwellia agarivorans TaxID=1911682 RepID=UPI000985813D|nr:methyl-accepting chemotaxis protein [Pseudocolwellia agarivorans]
MFKMENLKTKIMLLLVAIGLIPALIISIITTINNSEDVSSKVYNQLTAINQIKKQSIETYFTERKGDMSVLVEIASTMKKQSFMKLSAINSIKKAQLHDYLANNNTQLELLSKQNELHKHINTLSNSFSNKGQWKTLLDQYDTSYKPLLNYFGWYDFFILNNEGTVIYSVTRESDLGQNIPKDLNDSSFYQAFTLAQQSNSTDIQFADFKPYRPSNNDPAAFTVKPVTVKGKRIGYIAFQQPIEKINHILGNREGMGETGESYLVGTDNLMRSDSYLNPKDYSVRASFASNNKVETTAAINALKGKKDTQIISDYNNNPVVSSWDYLEVANGVRWAIISEVDVAEAFNPNTIKNEEFYKNYIEQYGYYDLFLIDTQGYIFYSVAKEADYQTNILTGKYSSSNLGHLIKQIQNSGQYGFIDYTPYAPSNNEPAAFIGQPILDPNGKTSLYIALQLPLEGIQNIMGVREGMGDSGESYLVGMDFKMRSNSFLDPEGHSVKASFAGTIEKNGVDTQAARDALAGKKGTNIITDYNGNPVLSSFDRIDFDNFSWAILSEIDEPEAFASINKNTNFMIILMVVFVVVIAFVGILFAGKIASPIIVVSEAAQRVAKGDLTIKVAKTSNDEVGHLQVAIQQMINNLASIVKNIEMVSLQQSSTSEELATITTQTSQTLSVQSVASDQLKTAMEEMGTTVNDVAASASTTSSAVHEIQNKVADSSTKISDTYNAILSMTDKIQDSEQSVQKVRADFSQVVTVLDVIKGIADQTNLLALNAAIEAARAGEQGRGFAVVADEVRQLAQRTQDSTKEINDMVNTIMDGANSSVEVMANSVIQANTVKTHAQEVNELNKVINDEMNQINDLSTQIATAAEEQSVVVKIILESVETLNIGVTETSTATEHIAESSVELAKLATDLEREVSVFKIT